MKEDRFGVQDIQPRRFLAPILARDDDGIETERVFMIARVGQFLATSPAALNGAA